MYHAALRDLVRNQDIDNHSAESLANALDVALAWGDEHGGIEGRDAVETGASLQAFIDGESIDIAPGLEVQVWFDGDDDPEPRWT